MYLYFVSSTQLEAKTTTAPKKKKTWKLITAFNGNVNMKFKVQNYNHCLQCTEKMNGNAYVTADKYIFSQLYYCLN